MSITPLHRVLDAEPVDSVDDYMSAGGGQALSTALSGGGSDVLVAIESAGLRGRGGAGFPTATKWRTVLEHSSRPLSATVVVNAAEGEPGSFKDRQLLLRNPYKVLEGASVAAAVVGADTAVIATKGTFRTVVARVRDAIDELSGSDLLPGAPRFEVIEGPDDYLYGEETALLEVVEGREPLPRVSPPFRHGVDDVGLSGTSADTQLASEDTSTEAAPVLVNNVETLAHVTDILRNGVDWFLEYGTTDQGGTFLCTVTGDTEQSCVVELPVGATLDDALSAAGGIDGRAVGALFGVSHPVVPADAFGSPLGYDTSGDAVPIGSGAFRFLSEDSDAVAVAAGASRFLADASCAQCEPCKLDGTEIADALHELAHGTPGEDTLEVVESRAATVADGARCALARQHRDIVQGLISEFPVSVRSRLSPDSPPLDPVDFRPLTTLEA